MRNPIARDARVVGSRAIMRDQLNHLADAAGHAKITLQVLPFGHGAHPACKDRSRSSISRGPPTPAWSIEHRSGAFYLEDPTEIKAHTIAFEHLCAHALRPDESVTMIRNVAKEYQ